MMPPDVSVFRLAIVSEILPSLVGPKQALKQLGLKRGEKESRFSLTILAHGLESTFEEPAVHRTGWINAGLEGSEGEKAGFNQPANSCRDLYTHTTSLPASGFTILDCHRLAWPTVNREKSPEDT